ncbi:MAG: dTMP kinase [Fusobacteriaceae bacterium]
MGKIIVIEGTDSSGKQTQSEILYGKIKEIGINVKKISFPNYESPACEPVKMYLAGEFGKEPGKINPYPISTMYAIDRYASYKTSWGDFYENGGVIITDRYTTSNMVHQASKIDGCEEKTQYLRWLEDLEYEKIGIPKPDLVIFLNMPTEFALKLMAERKNKITGEVTKDIHESDAKYLEKSHNTACEISKLQGWQEIICVDGDRIKSIEEISIEILDKVKNII